MRAEAVVPAGAVAAFLLVFGVFGGPGDAAPASRWLGLGALLAPVPMAYVHRGAAAFAAVLGAILWTALAATPGAALTVWAYAVMVFLLARGGHPEPPAPVPRRLPSRPAALPTIEVPAQAGGVALLGLAVAGLVRAGADERAASWLAGVLPAAGLGGALLARVVRDRRALRRLFGTAQPVRAVRAVEQLGYLHVLLPEPDGQTALEFGFDIAELDQPPDDEDDEPHTIAAVLYGEPRTGAWCAVEVGGRLHVPLAAVGEVIRVPYDEVHGLPREIEDDEEQLVDPAALRPADRDVGAFEPREHRIAPPRAWAATVAIALGAALAVAELARLAALPGAVLAVLVAMVAAASCEFGWRTQLRPRLRWHAGGVAAVGFRGPDRQPWATDSAVLHDDEGTVLLTAGEAVLAVPVPPPWPPGGAQRTADQLVAALREARTQSFAISPLPPPPEIETPRRPLPLAAVWALTVAAALVIVA
jgi:hypothetical protein